MKIADIGYPIKGPKGIRFEGQDICGVHPLHGSENTFKNYSINRKKNVWHCYRCNSGGGVPYFLAMKYGILECNECKPDTLTGNKLLAVVEKARAERLIPDDKKEPNNDNERAKKKSKVNERSREKQNPAEMLIELVDQTDSELWHTTDMEPFITMEIEDHIEHHRLKAEAVKRWLGLIFYVRYGSVPSSQTITNVVNVLEGRSVYQGHEYEVFTRVGKLDDTVFVDLGDKSWQAIEISKKGWRIISNPTVRFTRPKTMEPLPRPIEGGKWEDVQADAKIKLS